MKLNRQQLKSLIAEEINRSRSVLLENPRFFPVGRRAREEEDPDGYEGEVAKKALFHMSQQAQQLHDMLKGDENLKPWVKDKIEHAANDLEEAFKAVMYDKGPGQGRL